MTTQRPFEELNLWQRIFAEHWSAFATGYAALQRLDAHTWVDHTHHPYLALWVFSYLTTFAIAFGEGNASIPNGVGGMVGAPGNGGVPSQPYGAIGGGNGALGIGANSEQ